MKPTMPSGPQIVGPIQKYALSLQDGVSFFYSPSSKPNGAPPCKKIPKPFGSIIARLLSRRYVMHVAEKSILGSSLIEFAAPSGHSYVAWTLLDSDEICFRYDRLVGFSNGIDLHTIVNLQVGALASDDVFYYVARGPGILLFEGSGQMEFKQSVDNLTCHPNRIVAWTRDSSFRTASSTYFVDILFSDVYWKIETTGGILIEPNAGEGHQGNWMLHTLKKAYFPF